MDFIPIPYFGMLMTFLVAPALTFGFVILVRRQKFEVEKLRYRKEILELELRKEETRLALLIEEGKDLDRRLGEP